MTDDWGGVTSRGSARTPAVHRLSAQRVEAARARLAAEQRRRRLRFVGIPVAVVVLVVAVLIGVKLATGAGSPKSGQAATTASNRVIQGATSVPAATLNAVGRGTAFAVPKAVTAPALTSDGKPRVLYVGAEYCPYCATERWAVVVALSRSGRSPTSARRRPHPATSTRAPPP